MANLKEVRIRITSVTSTQQITKAMKMVSAAKLKRAQDAVTQMRPYANKLKDILENLSATLDTSENVYAKVREEKNVLVVLITSNRGLCGGFNSYAIKKALGLIKNDYATKKVSVMCIGKKGNDYFRKFEEHVHGSELPHSQKLNELFANLDYNHVAPVAQQVMDAFANGHFDKVVLVYNKFKNAAVQEVIAEQLLPISNIASDKKSNRTTDYILDPGKEEIVADLVPRSLKTQFYKAMLDSHASEHGARMTAMHKATDNAGAMIKDLKLMYNKARQASITKEILEIVGGAEALKG